MLVSPEQEQPYILRSLADWLAGRIALQKENFFFYFIFFANWKKKTFWLIWRQRDVERLQKRRKITERMENFKSLYIIQYSVEARLTINGQISKCLQLIAYIDCTRGERP